MEKRQQQLTFIEFYCVLDTIVCVPYVYYLIIPDHEVDVINSAVLQMEFLKVKVIEFQIVLSYTRRKYTVVRCLSMLPLHSLTCLLGREEREEMEREEMEREREVYTWSILQLPRLGQAAAGSQELNPGNQHG